MMEPIPTRVPWKWPLVIVTCILSTAWTSTNALTVVPDSSWSLQANSANKHVLSSDGLVTAKSKLHCLIQCRKYWNCRTIAYVKSSHQCYFNPTFDANSGGAVIKAVYNDKAPVCIQNNAPAVQNAAIDSGSLKQGLTSFELDVSCAADYRRVNTNIVAVRCLATGQWVSRTTEICKKQIYRNCLGESCGEFYPVPGGVQIGWGAQFTAVPTAESRFGFDLLDSSSNVLLHFNARLSYGADVKVTVLTCVTWGAWCESTRLKDPSPPFPFVNGQTFIIVFRASGANGIQIYVDGNLYATWTTQLAVTRITMVETGQSVAVSYADLWA